MTDEQKKRVLTRLEGFARTGESLIGKTVRWSSTKYRMILESQILGIERKRNSNNIWLRVTSDRPGVDDFLVPLNLICDIR